MSVWRFGPQGVGFTRRPYVAPTTAAPVAATATSPAAAAAAPTPPIVTGIEPQAYEAILYGKDKPLFVGGKALMGGRPCEGVFWSGTQANPLVSFIAYHAEAANPDGTRTITQARLRGKEVAYDGSGYLTAAELSGGRVQFLTGTRTQLPFDVSIGRYGAGAVAYKNGILSSWTNIPVKPFGGISPMPSIEISDSSFGDPADGITRKDAIEVLLRHSRLDDSEFEVDVPGSDPAWIVGSKSTLLEFLQRLRGMFVHWNITYTDKLRIIDPTDFTLDVEITVDNHLRGSMLFSKTDPLIIPRKKNYSYIDIDRDFEPNVVTAQEDLYPAPSTASVEEETIELPIVTTAAQATADVHVSLYEELAVRSQMEAVLLPPLFATEAGDTVQFADHADINFVGRVMETQHDFEEWQVNIRAGEVLNCGAEPERDVEFINHYERGDSVAAQAYLAINIGAEAPDRLVVIIAAGTTNNRTITSVTLNGTAMTIHRQVTGAGAGAPFHDLAMVICSLLVPTGTTADIVVNFSGLLSGSYISIWRVTGLISTTPHDTASGSSTGSNPVTTINVPANGIMFTGYAGGTTGFPGNAADLGAVTWAGVSTEDWDEILDTGSGVWWGSGAHQLGMSLEVGRAVSVTAAAPGRELIIAGTWR